LAGALLRAVAVTAFFQLAGPSPVLYALALMAEQAVALGASWICLRHRMPAARLLVSSVTRSALRETVGFNFLNLLANVNYVAFMQAPAFVLQRFEGLALAGFYGIGLQLNNLMRGLLSAVINALLPAAISLHSQGNAAQLQKLFQLTTKCFFALAA